MTRLIVWGLIIVGFLAVAVWSSQGPTGTGFVFAVLLYIAPILIAGIRNKVHPGPVIVVDLLLGWTVIGWVVALAMAFSGDTKADRLKAARAA